jgi:hypothetical protein
MGERNEEFIMTRKLIEVKEGTSNGVYMKGSIYSENGEFAVDYIISGNIVKTEKYPGKSMYYVEDAIGNWMSGVKIING